MHQLSCQILRISLYYAGTYEGVTSRGGEATSHDGKHARVSYHTGHFDVEGIIQGEMNGDYERHVNGNIVRCTGKERGRLIVAGKRLQCPPTKYMN